MIAILHSEQNEYYQHPSIASSQKLHSKTRLQLFLQRTLLHRIKGSSLGFAVELCSALSLQVIL
jgi:hypothetical protein